MRFLSKVALLLSIVSVPVWASSTNVGVVDIQAAIQKTKIYQDTGAKFNKDYAQDIDTLKGGKDAMKALYDKKIKASKTEVDDIDKQIKAKGESLNELQKKLDMASQELNHQIEKQVQPKLADIFKDVAAKNHFDMLIDKAAVLYMKVDKTEVTDQVTEKINQAISQ